MAARATKAAERPLTLDELATLDDVVATERVPATVVSQLASRRLTVAGVGKQIKPSRAEGPDDTWDLSFHLVRSWDGLV